MTPDPSIQPPLATTSTSGNPIDEIIRLVRESQRMVVFTGAGISTESGIPDYRGPNGVWARQQIPHIDTIRTDDASRMVYWRERRIRYPEMMAKQPNAGHRALVRFERAGKLLAIVTQNIDGLHQRAGNTPERVIELHGSTHRVRCLSCGRVWTGESVQQRLDAGNVDPRCPVCGGVLRVATILFGESLPERELRTAFAVAQACDLMLVVGSSLVVNPAARIPVIAKQGGASLIIINRTPTPIDDLADVAIQAESGPSLEVIANAVLGENTVTMSHEDQRDHGE
jgi:NAD-dependent deacetylase